MTFNDLINYQLIHTENISITPYDIFVILFILTATHFVIKLLKKIINRFVVSKKLEYSKSITFYQVIKYLLWILAISFSLESIGIKMTLFIAGSAALFVGLGLGLQQIFKDMVSGLILIIEENIKINDVVELDGVIGQIKQIGIRTSKILTRDNIVMTIPNSKFITDNLINWNDIESICRFYIEVGVAYSSDILKVEEILLECAVGHPDISNKNRPFVRLNNFGDSSLDFQLFFWTKNTFRVENIKSKLRFDIVEKFRENNIEIPFPQSDITIKNSSVALK